MNSHPRRYWSTWIAILAILLNSLMPTVAHAVSGKQSAPRSGWTEVCTTQGAIWIKVAADESDAAQSPTQPANAPQGTMTLVHCPYCLLHAGAPGLPAVVEHGLVTDRADSRPLPSASHLQIHSQAHWESPAVRAPPLA
ncbi:DUF2946 domain-containing protein [Rhodoferax sp. GW822-FHT02A01]|uniref:DUF2946 domain-containing protein n=1 Tax=Rhodoferax sp. GW822-FHT02A01 TaxID=3141537 RepID=UPI00315D19FC